MANLYMVEGKQSMRYNHFQDYRWESTIATDTRLMGVTALQITWKSKTSGYHIHQLIHLDFSEYGVDDYMEYYTDPKLRRLNEMDSRRELDDNWQRMSGSLGGSEIAISLGTTVRLIQLAVATNENYYRNYEEEIQEFRKKALARIRLMIEVAKKDSAYTEVSDEEATQSVCLSNLNVAETINYFLMRMCDKDYLGASLLSEISWEELSHIPNWDHQMMTLLQNRIKSTKDAVVFHCASMAEGESGYFYIRTRIGMSAPTNKKNPKVALFDCSYFRHCSEVEAAMQMQQTEYITVYELAHPEEFDPDMSMMISRSAMRSVPNGMLYLLYTKDNNHVDSYTYYMNNDVYGAYLVTNQGELVLMSPEVMKISTMEMDVAHTFIMQDLELKGRYRFDMQIFQSFCEMAGTRFEDIIQRD